jgi:hypothetical protein
MFRATQKKVLGISSFYQSIKGPWETLEMELKLSLFFYWQKFHQKENSKFEI